MFSFFGSAINNITDRLVDWIIPLDSFKFDMEDQDLP